jgi:hypothetical protein
MLENDSREGTCDEDECFDGHGVNGKFAPRRSINQSQIFCSRWLFDDDA